MSNTEQPKQPPEAKKPPEPKAIRVAKLLITHANPHGVRVPTAFGSSVGADKLEHSFVAGLQGEVLTEIERRPWLRDYRVTRSQRPVGKEPAKPTVEFYIPETWAISVPFEG